jgi:hypothetical protein
MAQQQQQDSCIKTLKKTKQTNQPIGWLVGDPSSGHQTLYNIANFRTPLYK